MICSILKHWMDSNRVFQKEEETVCRSPGDSVYYQSRIHFWKNSRCFLTDTYLFAATVVTLLLFVLQNHHVLGGGGGGGGPPCESLASQKQLSWLWWHNYSYRGLQHVCNSEARTVVTDSGQIVVREHWDHRYKEGTVFFRLVVHGFWK